MSKNVYVVYIDELDDIADEYNNTYHRTIKTKPIDVKSSTYIDFGVENNYEDPKFRVGDHIRISKYKNDFAKKKKKKTVPWKYNHKKHENIMQDLKDEEIVGMFYEKEL